MRKKDIDLFKSEKCCDNAWKYQCPHLGNNIVKLPVMKMCILPPHSEEDVAKHFFKNHSWRFEEDGSILGSPSLQIYN